MLQVLAATRPSRHSLQPGCQSTMVVKTLWWLSQAGVAALEQAWWEASHLLDHQAASSTPGRDRGRGRLLGLRRIVRLLVWLRQAVMAGRLALRVAAVSEAGLQHLLSRQRQASRVLQAPASGTALVPARARQLPDPGQKKTWPHPTSQRHGHLLWGRLC